MSSVAAHWSIQILWNSVVELLMIKSFRTGYDSRKGRRREISDLLRPERCSLRTAGVVRSSGRSPILMEPEPLIRRQAAFTPFGIMAVHLTQHFQHVATFVREGRRTLYKLPTSVCKTVGQQDLYS